MLEQDLLRQIDLLWGMSDHELKLFVSIATTKQYKEGEMVFKENDDSDELYILISGRIEIFTEISPGVPQVLGELHKGMEFGEMALINDEPRSASAKVLEDCELMAISRDQFLDLIGTNHAFAAKALINLSRALSTRLRNTTDILRQSMYSKANLEMLDIETLARLRQEVTLHLNSGGKLEGRILNINKGSTGDTLTIQTNSQELCLIPYHALVYVSIKVLGDSTNN